MASSKRQRYGDDDGHADVLDGESALSDLHQVSVSLPHFLVFCKTDIDQRKKARVSYDESKEPNSGAPSDDEQFEEQATQYVTQRRNKILVDNEPAENGIIESVTCTNFMCHSFLEISLGPLINFIIGHNGSGKSAVLTALTICLGGKAAATNRGGSLKSFIKEGEE